MSEENEIVDEIVVRLLDKPGHEYVAILAKKYAALVAERDRYKAALEKLANKDNYCVDRDGLIEWWPQEDREMTPWEYARAELREVTK